MAEKGAVDGGTIDEPGKTAEDWRDEFKEDVIELVRGLCPLIVGAEPELKRGAELELGPTLPPPWKLSREPVIRRPLDSVAPWPTSSPALSSDLKLLYVAIELAEIRLLRFLARVTSRSSEK